MSMTINQFKLFNPGIQEVALYYTNGNTISAINVSNVDCNNINLAQSLKKLTSLTLNIQGSIYTIPILTREVFTGYYHFSVEDTIVNGITSVNEEVCNETYLVPSINLAGFEKSDYNATLNNAIGARTTSFIYDVDRSKTEETLRPINYLAIMSDTATPASFQELNYSSIGITNSRYVGSKTNIDEYGIAGGVTLYVFDAAVYQKNIVNGNICSQSLSERSIEEYGFDSSNNLYPSDDFLPTGSYNYYSIDGFIEGTSGSPAEVTAQVSTFTARMKKSRVVNYVPGDILVLTTGITYASEFVQIESVTFNSNVDADEDNYDFIVTKNIDGPSNTITGIGNSNYNINILKVHSDTIYGFEGKKIIPLSERKVFIPLTGQILKTVRNGKVLRVDSICT